MATSTDELQALLLAASRPIPDVDALEELAEVVRRKGGREALVACGQPAGVPLVHLLSHDDRKTRKAAGQGVLELAHLIDGGEAAEPVLALLEEGTKAEQRLALQIVTRLRRPPLSLLEPVADLSSMPEAKPALLRFPSDAVKGELRSLIKSRDMQERIVGLELVQSYGTSAGEFAPLIAEVLAEDTQVETAKVAIHTLARLLPDAELAEALEPALDHWSEEVGAIARAYLEEADVPVRDSVWEGHPFSPALLRQLQRLDFAPSGPIDIPSDRPLPSGRAYEWGEPDPSDEAVVLSPTVWMLLNGLQYPPYRLYTVWGSWENTNTFHFSSEPPIYVIDFGETRHLMNVIGDGSIGYFAAIDLKDTSDDPPVYYMERWGGNFEHSTWRVAWSLSSYLRRLGTR